MAFRLEVEYFVEKQNEVYLDNIYRACAAGRTVSLDAEEWTPGNFWGGLSDMLCGFWECRIR